MTDEPDAPGQPRTSRRFGKRRPDPAFITQAAHESLDVLRAFGPAYERDGVRVIPVARVMGGTGSVYGGGSVQAGPGGPPSPDTDADADAADREEPQGTESTRDAVPDPRRRWSGRRPQRRGGDASGTGDGFGGSGGFGTVIKPLGIVIIDDRGTRWQPTIDVNRAILGGQIVMAVAVVTAGCVLSRRHTTVHRLGLPALPALPSLLHHRSE